ncbi:MAG: DUF58 domain-containing protein [Chitinophagales bacterium]|nr:DUF58 domain-containing protein [Chitinophagales bacterium]
MFLKDIYISSKFYKIAAIVIVAFIGSFVLPFTFYFCVALLGGFLFATISDFLYVKSMKGKVSCVREVPAMLPLGDEINIHIQVFNQSGHSLDVELVDELPEQFQKRNFSITTSLQNKQRKEVSYPVKALKRGVYQWGACHVYIQSKLGLLQKRVSYNIPTQGAVYPSIVQMKKHELQLQKNLFQFTGIKRLRRLGHSYEFEQIKNYAIGDDFRCINWKATGRRNQLMVNQFGDEKSQQVYSIIDKSRIMQMPFYGMSLLDYAVNTSLVIANTALHKYDKAGYISFSEGFGSYIKADNKPTQLKTILESLYKEKDSNLEANYELLFQAVKHFITQRSLLIIYTNFESYYSLERVLPILRKINQMHLLLVVIFKNTEIEEYSFGDAIDLEEVYTRTIGKKFLYEKETIIKEFSKYGIQAILTAPEDLSTNTINKYLEFKAKGWI